MYQEDEMFIPYYQIIIYIKKFRADKKINMAKRQ